MLGPTNTGKTHHAIEQMLSHRTGMIGLPLRLLAREVYDRVTARVGEASVALVTGEEKRVPPRPRYWICTVESMPTDREVDFVCVDEIQLAAHPQRGHAFTDRLLNARGAKETWFLGSDAMRPLIAELLPTAFIRRNPRLSKLSYFGARGIAALPPRTAVVAFSMAEVYELAERIRQRHGGTAVVLGALSPRARNAQVAMFESGEVEYMVATDAIGMGLNLNLSTVVFGSLRKFDGKEPRPLYDDELAQIAGRAGRFTTDGEFGVLNPLLGLEPRQVAAIEKHDFAPVRRLVWRNSDLDFASVDALLESLRRRPRPKSLRLVRQADDYDALAALARSTDVRARARGSEAVSLLWDVCRIPDFRRLLVDDHARLLAEIYGQLSGEGGRLEEDWMARRIARLDDTEGDIETLMNRIAFIRTWTYVSNHERWMARAGYWQEKTRAIEDRCSDALHERLTERFVDSGSAVPAPARPPRAGKRVAARETSVSASPGSPFAALAGLLPAPQDPVSEEDAWVEAVVNAGHSAFVLLPDGGIAFDGRRVGWLRRAADISRPDVQLAIEGAQLRAGGRRQVERRIVAWSHDLVASLWPDACAELQRRATGALRGLLYTLQEQFGTADARRVRQQLNDLTSAQRSELAAAGVVVGGHSVFVSVAHRAEALRTRQVLWGIHRGRHQDRVRSPAMVSISSTGDWRPSDFATLGFVPRGPRAIRADALETAHARLCALATAHDPFVLPAGAAAWFGCSNKELIPVLAALGVRAERENKFTFSTRRRRKPRSGRHP